MASMARSRAVSGREPGQIREEAALSGTAHAPRGSLAVVTGRRARPGTNFDVGCTVQFFLALEVVAQRSGVPPPRAVRIRFAPAARHAQPAWPRLVRIEDRE